MEHPYLFFVKLFDAIGAGHFAHAYPQVVYSWVVMAFLIIAGAFAAKGVSMIPTKGQNLFEVLIQGMEDFMVDITGEEGRWLFPIIATVFIYIFVCNLSGLLPGFFPPTASLNTTLSCALVVVIFTHRTWTSDFVRPHFIDDGVGKGLRPLLAREPDMPREVRESIARELEAMERDGFVV